MMEDFPRQNITLTQTDGLQEVKTTNDAISKIPVQFVLRGKISGYNYLANSRYAMQVERWEHLKHTQSIKGEKIFHCPLFHRCRKIS